MESENERLEFTQQTSGLIRSKTGWLIHLLLLVLYPVVLAILGSRGDGARVGTLLPGTLEGLVWMCVIELGIFGAVFCTAWTVSRASPEELLLRWQKGLRPVILGLTYSVGLRIGVGVIAAIAIALAMAAGGSVEAVAEKMRPQTEVLVDAAALIGQPLYFGLMLTVVSFVLAGLREELWRAGVLAGLAGLFPRQFSTTPGKFMAVALAAIVFGLGHLSQGWGGVGLTASLGMGLGAIMVLHKSIWEAVFAHGFFNAASFAMLYVGAKYFPGKIPGF